MAFKLFKKRRHKIYTGVLLGAIALLLVASILINRYWSPILAQRVHSVVLSSSDSLYKVDFTDAEFHFLSGQLVIYNISIRPDTAVYNRRKLQHTAPNNLYVLHVKRLIIEHMHPLKLYFERKLDIGDIILNAPDLEINYQLNHTKDTVLKDHRTVWQKMSKALHSIHIGGIFLNDVKFKYKDYSGNRVLVSELKQMSLSATDLLIDSASQFDKTRMLYCKELVGELNNYSGKTNDGLYSYKVNHLKLSTRTSQLNVEGFTLKPIKTDAFFNRTKKDRYNIQIDSLQLNNFNYLDYHKYRTVKASVMIIKQGDFSLFNNPNKSQSNSDKIGSFPSVALRSLSTNIQINKILIHHTNIAYSEFNKKSDQTGTISFNNTSGYFLNVTNNAKALQKNNICTIKLTSYFMNRGLFNLLIDFNLTDKNAPYNYKGELGPMDLRAINPAIMPLSMVQITGGTIKSFSFDVHADSHIAKGKIELLYNNLKVKLLKRDTMFGLKNKLIESLYANLFIIKHDNPDQTGGVPRIIYVTYERPINSPFFKTVWSTLLNGIKPSAGVDAKMEHTIIEKKNERTLKKQQHMERKALRKERRAEKKREKELGKGQNG